ncbi:MAG: hypothetical protein R2771_10150 [Saprospiraceae bacterium]
MNNIFKLVFIILFFNFFIIGKSYSQEFFQYRINTGIGLSLLGSGDNNALNIENELGVNINKWISTTCFSKLWKSIYNL